MEWLPNQYNKSVLIIQAGGEGTRLKHLTNNKPKALLTYKGLPIIFHYFDLFKCDHTIIIGDYKYEVLEKYLSFIPRSKYTLIRSYGKGTCSGLLDALELISIKTRIFYVWSDLYFERRISIPDYSKPIIFVTNNFYCRWKFSEDKLYIDNTNNNGVFGLFYFPSKLFLDNLPNSGEFVKYLANKIDLQSYNTHRLSFIEDLGDIEKIDLTNVFLSSRSFNRIELMDDFIIKTPIGKKGRDLAKDEIGWYKFVSGLNYKFIPKIICYTPLKLEKHIPAIDLIENFTLESKKNLLFRLLDVLSQLNKLGSKTSDEDAVLEMYYNKTYERLDFVRRSFPRIINNRIIKINNSECISPFFLKDIIYLEVKSIAREVKKFDVIHGDLTLSNVLTKYDDLYLIDPRGYFGSEKIFGDSDYDIAKIYYSFFGGYDLVNKGKYEILIDENDIVLSQENFAVEQLEEAFWNYIGAQKKEKIELLHALIWLSLTGYVWENYDTMMYSFSKGTLLLNDWMNKWIKI